MDKQKEKFLEGAKDNGVPEKIAAKIYEQIEPFAGYAFNKAHAVCYAFVAYRTAYMKANYPVEYYAALLSANMDDKDKLAIYIEDCRRFGIDGPAAGCERAAGSSSRSRTARSASASARSRAAGGR